MDVPEDVLIDISDIGRYKPEQITIITTGSQGEPMSARSTAWRFFRSQSRSSSPRAISSCSQLARDPRNEVLVGKIIKKCTAAV